MPALPAPGPQAYPPGVDPPKIVSIAAHISEFRKKLFFLYYNLFRPSIHSCIMAVLGSIRNLFVFITFFKSLDFNHIYKYINVLALFLIILIKTCFV